MTVLEAYLTFASIGCIVFFQRNTIRGNNKETNMVRVLLLFTFILSILLLIYPELPGPTSWINHFISTLNILSFQ